MRLHLLALVLLSGCTTSPLKNISQTAYLYDTKGEVTSALFTWQGTPAGSVVLDRPTEACIGEHSTLVDGVDTRSLMASFSILRAASSSPLVGETSTFGGTPSFGVVSTANKVQRGMAMLVCPSAEVIQCQYMMNVFSDAVVGFGSCTTNKGDVKYQLLFK